MIDILLTAFCLMLVIEGMLPFLAPSRWRQLMIQAAAMQDTQIRGLGLASMLLGALLIYVIN